MVEAAVRNAAVATAVLLRPAERRAGPTPTVPARDDFAAAGESYGQGRP